MTLTILRKTYQGNILRKVMEKDVDGRQNKVNTVKQMLKELPRKKDTDYFYRVDFGKLESL